MDILHGIEAKALALRGSSPVGMVAEMELAQADIALVMERPLYAPPIRPMIAELALHLGDEDIDPSALFEQVMVDKARLTRHIRHALQERTQVTLGELVTTQPLQQGLAELVAYLQLGSDNFSIVVDEANSEPIRWHAKAAQGQALIRSARLPRVIFMR